MGAWEIDDWRLGIRDFSLPNIGCFVWESHSHFVARLSLYSKVQGFIRHQYIAVILESQVALLIDKVVGFSLLGLVQVGEILEIESKGPEVIAADTGFATGIGPDKDTVILPQRTVDESNQFTGSSFASVMKAATTLIRTKTLIGSPS